jgi:hypothetical protein
MRKRKGKRGKGKMEKEMEKREEKWEKEKEEGEVEWVCAGGGHEVRGPGEVCTAWCAGQGRQRRVWPAIIAVGGRAWATGRRAARDGMARKRRVRYGQQRMESGVGAAKDPGRVLGFRDN